MRRTTTIMGLLAVLAAALVGTTAPAAQAATTVTVESQITAHNLPYLASTYVDGSTLLPGARASVECQAAGREAIAGSYTWYRINALYYPSYAFSGTPTHPACGVAFTVPNTANGWFGTSWQSKPVGSYFTGGTGIRALCRAPGDTTDGNNAWFFARGYWIHSSRLAGEPGGEGMSVCRGFSSIPKPSWVPSQYWGLINTAANRYAINPRLIASQLRAESSFNPNAESPAGAQGIAQFLPGTWNGSWNVYRNSCARDAFDPVCAIPAAGLYMRIMRGEARSKVGDIPRIKQIMAARSDVSQAMIDAINWNDRYQFALMGYIAGWGNYSIWGPMTANYPVKIWRQAFQP